MKYSISHPILANGLVRQFSCTSCASMIVSWDQTPSMAATFATTELLELILLRLPIADTIVATRVCRYWRQVIERSPSIRKRVLDPATPVFTGMPKQRLRGEAFRGPTGRPAQALVLRDLTDVRRILFVRTYFVMQVDTGHVLVYKEGGVDAVFLYVPREWQFSSSRRMPLEVLGGSVEQGMMVQSESLHGGLSVKWYADGGGEKVVCEKVFQKGLLNRKGTRKEWYERVFFQNHYGSWGSDGEK